MDSDLRKTAIEYGANCYGCPNVGYVYADIHGGANVGAAIKIAARTYDFLAENYDFVKKDKNNV